MPNSPRSLSCWRPPCPCAHTHNLLQRHTQFYTVLRTHMHTIPGNTLPSSISVKTNFYVYSFRVLLFVSSKWANLSIHLRECLNNCHILSWSFGPPHAKGKALLVEITTWLCQKDMILGTHVTYFPSFYILIRRPNDASSLKSSLTLCSWVCTHTSEQSGKGTGLQSFRGSSATDWLCDLNNFKCF